MLSLYDVTVDTKISADASSYGLVVVLLQKHNGKWKPIAFVPHSLTDTERRYVYTDQKEALAITWVCEKFVEYTDSTGNLSRSQTFGAFTGKGKSRLFTTPGVTISSPSDEI